MQIKLGYIKNAVRHSDRVIVYFQDGSSKAFEAAHNITSTQVAVIGDRVYSPDANITELVRTEQVFKARTNYEENGVETWAYLFNLYDHTDSSLSFTETTWATDTLDGYIRPMGEGGGNAETKQDAWILIPEIEEKSTGTTRKLMSLGSRGFSLRAAMGGYYLPYYFGVKTENTSPPKFEGYWGAWTDFGQYAPLPKVLGTRTQFQYSSDFFITDERGNQYGAYSGSYPDPPDGIVGDIGDFEFEAGRQYFYQELWGIDQDIEPIGNPSNPKVLFTISSHFDPVTQVTSTGQRIEYFYEGVEAVKLRSNEPSLNNKFDHTVNAGGYLTQQDFDNGNRYFAGSFFYAVINIKIGYSGVLDYDSTIYSWNFYNPTTPHGMTFHKNFTTLVESVDDGDYMSHPGADGRQALEDAMREVSQGFYDSFINQFVWNLPPTQNNSMVFSGGSVSSVGVNVRNIDIFNDSDPLLVDPLTGLSLLPYRFNLILESAQGNYGRIVLIIPEDYFYVDSPDGESEYYPLDAPFYRAGCYIFPLEKSRPKGKRSLYCQVGNNNPVLLKEIPKTEAYDSVMSPIKNTGQIEVLIKTGKLGDFEDLYRAGQYLSERYGMVPNNLGNSRYSNFTAGSGVIPQTIAPYHFHYLREYSIVDVFKIDSSSGAVISHDTYDIDNPPATIYYNNSSISQFVSIHDFGLSSDNWQINNVSHFLDSRDPLYVPGRAVSTQRLTNVRNINTAYSAYFGEYISPQRCVRYKDDSSFKQRGIFQVTRTILDTGTLVDDEFVYVDIADLAHEDYVNVTHGDSDYWQGVDKPGWDSAVFDALVQGKMKKSVYYTVSGTYSGGSIWLGGAATFEASFEHEANFPLLKLPSNRTFYEGAVDAIAFVKTD